MKQLRTWVVPTKTLNLTLALNLRYDALHTRETSGSFLLFFGKSNPLDLISSKSHIILSKLMGGQVKITYSLNQARNILLYKFNTFISFMVPLIHSYLSKDVSVFLLCKYRMLVTNLITCNRMFMWAKKINFLWPTHYLPSCCQKNKWLVHHQPWAHALLTTLIM